MTWSLTNCAWNSIASRRRPDPADRYRRRSRIWPTSTRRCRDSALLNDGGKLVRRGLGLGHHRDRLQHRRVQDRAGDSAKSVGSGAEAKQVCVRDDGIEAVASARSRPART